jgi:glycine amidinotransferase
MDFSQPIITAYWSVPGGLYAAMPRDILLVVRDKIIVAPMSWRSRYREAEAYRELLDLYKRLGYEILIAPKPHLEDDLYRSLDVLRTQRFASILTENEPVFDAADFIVLDGAILVQESHVTNMAGINWVRNHLVNEFEITILEFNDAHRMHIDGTMVPLREGLFLVNPERVNHDKIRSQLPAELKSWVLISAPEPVVKEVDPPRFMSSDWLNVNVFTLDSHTVVVEEAQLPLIRMLESHGFDVIPLAFKNFHCFGGSFHCATQEIIRDGVLPSGL